MSDNFEKLAVVIPTRNRPDLAITAINSVLNQKNSNFELFVSDNSTDADALEKLGSFCNKLNDPRVNYVRPPNPLPMSDHWEWIRKLVTQNKSFTHLIVLTDRMILRAGGLEKLIEVARQFPEKVISYPMTSLYDDQIPYRLIQRPYSEKVIKVDSLEVAKASSEFIFPESLPRMLDCLVPVSIFEKFEKKYGKVFESVSPDYCFAYKVLDTEKDFLFLDTPILLSYNAKGSNGRSIMSGEPTKESKKFLEEVKSKNQPLNQLTPSPQLITLSNAIISEYLFVKKINPDSKLPELNLYTYYKVNSRDINDYVTNEERKKELLEICESQRLKHKDKISFSDVISYYRNRITLKRLFSKLYFAFDQKINRKENSINLRELKFDNKQDAINAFHTDDLGKTNKSWVYLASAKLDVGFSKQLKKPAQNNSKKRR